MVKVVMDRKGGIAYLSSILSVDMYPRKTRSDSQLRDRVPISVARAVIDVVGFFVRVQPSSVHDESEL